MKNSEISMPSSIYKERCVEKGKNDRAALIKKDLLKKKKNSKLDNGGRRRMCAECNARSFCLWCYSGKAAGDVYSTEWRAAICMLVCLLMVCSWKDGRN